MNKGENDDLKDDINNLKKAIKMVQSQLEVIESHSLRHNVHTMELLAKSNILIEQGDKMTKHITFIEQLYKQIKKPFHWILNTIEKIHFKYVESDSFTARPLFEMNNIKNYLKDKVSSEPKFGKLNHDYGCDSDDENIFEDGI